MAAAKNVLAARRISGTSRTALTDPDAAVRSNWSRYEYCKMRGHVNYCERAVRNQEMWAGGGLQWLPDDREQMEVEQLAKAFEINEIFDAVNTAIGYQIHNRLDISFRPRGQGATEEIATTLSKVAMQIADRNRLRWTETDVYRDGMIFQRGYYEIRMRFDEHLKGEIEIVALDPLDVIPDPDGKSYDPDGWADVMVTRWLTLDEIEVMYGKKQRDEVERRFGQFTGERDFGTSSNEVPRNKFGEEEWGAGSAYDAYYIEGGIVRIRVIDRQYWQMKAADVVVYPTGEVRNAEHATDEQRAAFRAQGCITMRRMQKRVRWLVTTYDVELFNDWSPYDKFTIVPYFPYFIRGLTRGYVDNAISPQELTNKVTSKIVQIIASTPNSGYIVEEESLANMSVDDLRATGGQTGIVIEYHKGSQPPEKIQPGQAPVAFFELANYASSKIKLAMGSPDSLKGDRGKNQSGIGGQVQQFADQITLATPLDNLSRTRHLLVDRMIRLIQCYMDEPRIERITKTDPISGRKTTEELHLNMPQDDGSIINDLTIGEYDAVIAEVPAQVTFENSQYNQALEMKKEGVAIPDSVLIRLSTLENKADLIDQMQQNAQNQQGSALDIAKAALAQSQALNQKIQAIFAAIRTAQIATALPGVAAVADEIFASAGGTDETPSAGGGPIPVTAGAGGAAPMPPTNTNPLTTGHADVGAHAGIEGGQSQPPPGG